MSAYVIGSQTYEVRADSFYVRTGTGVWLRNNLGSFSIDGQGAYEAISVLFRELDGKRTLADICAGLGPGARRTTQLLLTTLERNGFVRVVAESREPAPAWAERLYPEHLAFLDHHSEDGVGRFMSVRAHKVICAGDGTALRAMLVALAEMGFAHVQVTAMRDEGLGELLAAVEHRDSSMAWDLRTDPDIDLMDFLMRTDAETVLVATDGPAIPTLAGVEKAAREEGRVFGAVAPVGGYLVATPLNRAGDAWCWECLRRSVVPHTAPAADPMSPTAAALAAFQLVNRAFCRAAGEPVPEDRQLLTVDPVTAVAKAHIARPHPDHPHAPKHPATAAVAGNVVDETVRPDIPRSEDPQELLNVQDRIVQAAASWLDEITGPLLFLGEGELPQTPLAASSCMVRGPAHRPETVNLGTFVCRGVGAREARNQVILHALDWMAAEAAASRGESRLRYAAGWSPAEALYRALAAEAADRDDGDQFQLRLEALPLTPVGTYLLDTLREVAQVEPVLHGRHLTSGFVQVTIDGDGATGHGVGLDTAHAAGNALMVALAAALGTPGPPATTRHSAAPHAMTRHMIASLLPLAASWTDALEQLKAQGDVEVSASSDASHLLPFLDGRAFIATVPKAGRHDD